MPKRAEQVFNAMGLCVQNQSWLWELIPWAINCLLPSGYFRGRVCQWWKTNPKKKGFYLWLGYYWHKDAKKFYLCIGRSTEQDGKKELQKCQAYDKIVKPNGDDYYRESYDDLEADFEDITSDFLRFANEFNQIPTACFELEPSSASH